MRKFRQNKLWRDKAIDMLEAEGSRIHWRYLSQEEFVEQLGLKLLEEAGEVVSAKDRAELVSELADVLEVLESIAASHGIASEEIAEAKCIKRENRGGFMGRKFVESSEHPKGSRGEHYCLSAPERYPEIGEEK